MRWTLVILAALVTAPLLASAASAGRPADAPCPAGCGTRLGEETGALPMVIGDPTSPCRPTCMAA